jgi:uncharacterized membrane protein YbhN (UPF0104 family)
MKQYLGFALKFAFSAALIAYMAFTFDLGDATQRIAEVDAGWIAISVAIFALLMANNALRWEIVVLAIGSRLGFWPALRMIYIAAFFNQALPSTIGGDAARMVFSRRAGLSLAASINSVMLERVVAVLGLILLVVATQPFLLSRIGDSLAKYVFPLLAAGGIAGICFLMVLDRMPERWRKWSLVRGLAQLAADAKSLFLHPVYAAAAIGCGVIGQLLISGLFFALAKALDLSHIDLLDCIVLIPPVILITTIPISIAGWGLREGAMVTVFAFVGVARGDAFVLSILFGVVNLALSLPAGLVWLASGGRKMSDETGPSHDQTPN